MVNDWRAHASHRGKNLTVESTVAIPAFTRHILGLLVDDIRAIMIISAMARAASKRNFPHICSHLGFWIDSIRFTAGVIII